MSHHHGERSPVGLHQDAALHALLCPIGGVGVRKVPPKRALPIAPSAACHSHSTPPNSSHSSTRAAQIRSKTPSPTHRWNARCTEESSGNSFGSRFHWQPVRSLKTTASRTARRSTRGRPIFLGRVVLGEDRPDPFPQLVRHAPDRREGLSFGRCRTAFGHPRMPPLWGTSPMIPDSGSSEIVT